MEKVSNTQRSTIFLLLHLSTPLFLLIFFLLSYSSFPSYSSSVSLLLLFSLLLFISVLLLLFGIYQRNHLLVGVTDL
jgi:hypothetical protein